MPIGKAILAAVLIWLLLGALAALIAQYSPRLRPLLAAVSAWGYDTAVASYDRHRGARRAARDLYTPSEVAHLNLGYAILIVLGPLALIILFILWGFATRGLPPRPPDRR